MTIRVILAGATGWAGSAVAKAIGQNPDLRLAAAVSRTHAGKDLADVLSSPLVHCPVYASAAGAVQQPADVFFEFTKPDTARENVLIALRHGLHVVIGTSGLTEADFAEIAAAAEKHQRGVLAVGNFALTVVLLQKFAETAARYIPQWEIIDYAHDDKKDAPSGTTRELAHRLSQVRPSALTVPLEETQGPLEARGTRLNGSQIHSVRLPGYTISAEIILGMPDQKLTIRHDSGSSAQPYVDGALIAIRRVHTFSGLRRGLDQVLDL